MIGGGRWPGKGKPRLGVPNHRFLHKSQRCRNLSLQPGPLTHLRQLFGSQPRLRLRSFYYFSVPPLTRLPEKEKGLTPEEQPETRSRPSSTSPFSLLFLLSCCLSLLPSPFLLFLCPSSTPPFPASSPDGTTVGLRSCSSELPSPLLPSPLPSPPPQPCARGASHSQSARGLPRPRPQRPFRAGPAEPRPRVRRAAPRGGGRWGLADQRRPRGARLDVGVRGCERAKRALRRARDGPALAWRGRAGGEGGARAWPAGRAARGMR